MQTGLDILRSVTLNPYKAGPTFTLTTYATTRRDSRGQTAIGYIFKEGDETIFCAEDFFGSLMHSDDSDDTLRGLLWFLTLRKGDTDAEYFEKCTDRQLAFRDTHAETLSMYCEDDVEFE